MNTITRFTAAALVVVGGLTAGFGLSTAQATELKLASFVPAGHQLQKKVWEPLAEELADATDGELQLKIYPAGQLGSGGREQYKRVISGVADIVHGLPGYTSSQFPLSLLTELPGVAISDVQATEGIWNAMPLIEQEYRRVKVLALFATESGVLMMRDKAVRMPSDLKGLKIRVPSANIGNAVSAWGAIPVSMPITEVYNAAQTGVIDGVLLGGAAINSFKLHEVFDHYTTGIPSTSSVIFLLMNRNSYDKLTAKERAALDRLTGFPLSQKSNKAHRDQRDKGMEAVRKAGKDIIELSPEVSKQFRDLSLPVIEETVTALEREGMKDAGKIVELMGLPYQGDK